MQFDYLSVQSLRSEKNPTGELLTMWSHYNHTILELFVLLSRMQHYQAMNVLRPLVDPKYHVLIDKGEGNLQRLSKQKLSKRPKDKDLNIDTTNFNQVHHEKFQPAQPAIPKIILEDSSDEESRKILNQPRKSLSPLLPPSNSNNLLLESPVAVQRSSALQNLSSSLKKVCEISEANLPLAQFEELAVATDNWNKRNTLGKGGFGTVYRGTFQNRNLFFKKHC